MGGEYSLSRSEEFSKHEEILEIMVNGVCWGRLIFLVFQALFSFCSFFQPSQDWATPGLANGTKDNLEYDVDKKVEEYKCGQDHISDAKNRVTNFQLVRVEISRQLKHYEVEKRLCLLTEFHHTLAKEDMAHDGKDKRYEEKI